MRTRLVWGTTAIFIALWWSDPSRWSWAWVLSPLWMAGSLSLAGTIVTHVFWSTIGVQEPRPWRHMARIAGRDLLPIAILPALKLAGQISWPWWWVVSPLGIAIGFWLLAIGALFAARTLLGADKLIALLDNAIVGVMMFGVGGFFTIVLIALKLAGAVNWSWGALLVPLGINAALWIALYAAYVSFAVVLDRLMKS